ATGLIAPETCVQSQRPRCLHRRVPTQSPRGARGCSGGHSSKPMSDCAHRCRIAGGVCASGRSLSPPTHCKGADLRMKLIHITDTHLVEPGLKLYGLDPKARLDAAIADINRHHSDAALAIITGDLTHWGEVGAYRNFLHSMNGLCVPYVVLVGNHDRRAAC